MTALVFGTGKFYQKYKSIIPCDIVGLIDNDPEKKGKQLDGHTIMSVDDIANCVHDCLYILVKDYTQIEKQLKKKGVPKKKILTYKDLPVDFCVDDDFCSLKDNGKKKVILFSHTFSVTGAALELFYVATCLKKMGCFVYVAAPTAGNMQMLYREREIPTIIDDRISTHSLCQIEWLSQFDFIWINTAILCTLLKKVTKTKSKIILWLHEPKYWYKLVSEKILSSISLKCLSVYSVSSVATDAFTELNHRYKVEPLVIGVPEKVLPKKRRNKVMNFAIVAEVFNLKGQDILLHALCYLSSEILNGMEVFFVGRVQPEFLKQIEILLSWFPNVHVLGEKSRDEICEIYAKTDVLICPSRVESFSLVTVEAAMNEIPTIVTNSAGVSNYIEDMKDGFVFENENAEELAKKIEWCYRNRGKCVLVGKAARKKYEKLFSISSFENRLLNLFEKEWGIK